MLRKKIENMNIQIEKNKNSFKGVALCVIISLLFGWMIAAMAVTGSWNVKKFYDAGHIYDVDFNIRMMPGEGIAFENGHYTVNEPAGVLYYNLTDNYVEWNYLYVTLRQMNGESMQWNMQFYYDGVLQGERQYEVREGKNEINVSGLAYNAVVLSIQGQQKSEFVIEKMQFRENPQCIVWTQFLLIMFGSGAVFCGGLFAVLQWLTCRHRGICLYAVVDFLQEFWIQAASVCGEKVYSMSDRKRNRWRSSLIFCMIFGMAVFENMVNLHSKPYYGSSMLFCSICLLGMATVSIERKPHKLNWNNPLVLSWVSLWLVAIVSDVIVNKRYQYQGYIMLIVVGYFFFIWGNMRRPKQMLACILKGSEGVFWVTTLFIYFCRPEIENARFLGFFRNTNIEAAFSAAAMMVFLVELDRAIAKNQRLLSMMPYVLGALIACDRTWRTASRTGQITILVTVAVFLLHNIHHAGENHRIGKLFQTVCVCILLLYPVIKTDDHILTHLADALGTRVIYEHDALMGYKEEEEISFTMEVYAASTEELQIIDTSGRRNFSALFQGGNLINTIEAYSSGRTLYYLDYIREMNLFGHYYHAKNWGDYIYPHNGVLEIMYRYGIFAGIPYVIMVAVSFWYGFMYARKKSNYTAYKIFPLLSAVSFFCTMIYENSEKPFVWMTWILYYVGMGILFVQGETDEED